MKKAAALLILLLLLLPMTVSAEEGECLTVETRSSVYHFQVGDRFTYSFWLRLTPDLVDSNISVSEKLELSLHDMSGSILYDTDCLILTDASFPNLRGVRSLKAPDPFNNTFLDGTLFDFTNGEFAFYSVNTDVDEGAIFRERAILVTCSFYVARASETPVYLRTKLSKLNVTTSVDGRETEIIVITRGQAKYPYESYETVNDEEPDAVLKSLVDDVGLDIRYLGAGAITETGYHRPGAGVAVTMMGMTMDGRWINLEKKTDQSGVLWFYDVPYGQYYVCCSYTDADGTRYATPDPEKAEHINVPATGEIQALWLIAADPEQTLTVDVTVDWVGDDGYLPVRPEYLYAALMADGSFSAIENRRAIERTLDTVHFDCIDRYWPDGTPISYSLSVFPADTESVPYVFSVEKQELPGSDLSFLVTATYVGDPADLNQLPRDPNGHYWEIIDLLSVMPTTQREGRVYSVCAVCHQTRYDAVPVLEPGTVWLGVPFWDAETASAYADGVPVTLEGDIAFIPNAASQTLTICESAKSADGSSYPTKLYVFLLHRGTDGWTAEHVPELDNVLQYAGSSVRISGDPGIRMITGIPLLARQKLIGEGLAGFTLQEYGTLVAWTEKLGKLPLIRESEGVQSAHAYRKGVADPVYRRTGTALQYTNVLVGFTQEKCVPELSMRPYMVLEDASGRQYTLYGGIVRRSIGYIAAQNRSAFPAGSTAYRFLWDIIHYVYKSEFDADYRG